jgi:ADP-ribose pyrophosphatase
MIPPHAQKVFSGEIFDVYHWQQEMFDGSMATFERLKRADTVSVIPITDDGQVLFAKEEQPGTAPFLGTFGGRVDPGEDALAAAKRELLEETGYEADSWEMWFSSHPSSKVEWAVHVYVAKGLRRVGEPHLDPGEKIEVASESLENFLKIIVPDPTFRDSDIALAVFQHTQTDAQRQKLIQRFKSLQP